MITKELKPLRCEARREKPTYHVTNSNPSGKSFQKCGRVAKFRSGEKLICKKCVAEDSWLYKDAEPL